MQLDAKTSSQHPTPQRRGTDVLTLAREVSCFPDCHSASSIFINARSHRVRGIAAPIRFCTGEQGVQDLPNSPSATTVSYAPCPKSAPALRTAAGRAKPCTKAATPRKNGSSAGSAWQIAARALARDLRTAAALPQPPYLMRQVQAIAQHPTHAIAPISAAVAAMDVLAANTLIKRPNTL